MRGCIYRSGRFADRATRYGGGVFGTRIIAVAVATILGLVHLLAWQPKGIFQVATGHQELCGSDFLCVRLPSSSRSYGGELAGRRIRCTSSCSGSKNHYHIRRYAYPSLTSSSFADLQFSVKVDGSVDGV